MTRFTLIPIAAAAVTAAFFLSRPDSTASPSLLPFQARLTDATGVTIPDGARVVQFKMYDAPVGGTAVWAGEVHKLTVNGGLVNTILGSKVSLSGVDFSGRVYLEITVDATGDDNITAADPPLLPRQSVVPAIFAAEAGNTRTVEGVDLINEANGTLNPALIANDSITGAQLAGNSVDGGEIVDGAVATSDLGDAQVTAAKIAAGAIDPTKLSPDFAVMWGEFGRGNTDSGNGGNPNITRELTTDHILGTSITRAGNEIVLSEGTYYLQGQAPCFSSRGTQVFLRETTLGTLPENELVLHGDTVYAEIVNGIPGVSGVSVTSSFRGIVEVPAGGERRFDIYQWFELANAGPGLTANVNGNLTNPSQKTIMAQVTIQRLK